MRHAGLATLAMLLLAVSGIAGDDYAIKVYPCPRFAAAPAIDGALSDACWKQAPVVSGFTRYDKPELMQVQTSFRVGYDDTCLYFGVHCDEPNAKRLTPAAAGRDTGQVFRGETIELFLDPAHDHQNYYQLAVNLANSFYDSRRTESSWNSATKSATKLLADAWTLELAVPWRDLGVKAPKQGMIVGFNICRDRYAGGAREWSNWSQTKANFHDPHRFAHLVLSPTDAMLGGMAAEFRKGDRGGPIVIFTRSGSAAKAYLAMARESLKRLDALLAELAAEGQKEHSAAARAEVARRLADARTQVEPFRTRIASGEPLDGAEWTRLDIQLHALARKLRVLLWDARLAALLQDI